MGGVGVLAKGGDLEVEEEQKQRDEENKEEVDNPLERKNLADYG